LISKFPKGAHRMAKIGNAQKNQASSEVELGQGHSPLLHPVSKQRLNNHMLFPYL